MKVKRAKHPGEVIVEMNFRDEELMVEASSLSSTSAFQIKKILVPIDYSECANKSLRYAIPLAKEHKAAITLLHVIPNNHVRNESGGVGFGEYENQLITASEKELEKFAEDAVCGEVPVDTQVHVSAPDVGVIKVADQFPADLIGISTHGHTGLKHAFLGSVAEHVQRRAPCPVLVVREHERDFVAD